MKRLNVLVVHDFDEPLFIRKTCLRRAFWLMVYALFGWSQRVRNKIPRWLMYEKYSQAKSLALLDRRLDVNAVFAFTEKVNKTFPTLKEEIEKLGFDVVDHWHLKEPRKGFGEWRARGAWDRIVDYTKIYMNYDRHYVMSDEKVIPEDGTSVCWHVDHLSYNMFYYLEFLNLIEEKDRRKTPP